MNYSGDKKTVTDGNIVTRDVLEALRRGDDTAFNQVFLAYWSPIYYFLKKLTRSEYAANEIAQDIFMGVWERREQIELSKNFKSYLYTIARNSAINYFNKLKVQDKYLSQMAGEPLEYSDDTEEALEEKELEILIEIAVSNMPKLRREVFRLKYYEGLDNEQIAQKLEMSKENVANNIMRARKDLREIVRLFLALFII